MEETDHLWTSCIGESLKRQNSEVPLVNFCLYKQAIIILSCLNFVKPGGFFLHFICNAELWNAGSLQTECCGTAEKYEMLFSAVWFQLNIWEMRFISSGIMLGLPSVCCCYSRETSDFLVHKLPTIWLKEFVGLVLLFGTPCKLNVCLFFS